MLPHFEMLSDEAEMTPAQAALQRAAEAIAGQAEALADEMEIGAIADRGGPDALRLFAAVVRMSRPHTLAPAGHA